MQTDLNKKAAYIIAVAIAAAALYVSSLSSYVLFHSMAELFSIVIAAGIFVVAWNTRKFMPNAYLLFIGVAYLYIAFIDLVHTLAYKSMGVFPGADANLPTQLWIAGRYMEAVSLFAAPLFLGKKLRVVPVLIAYFFATVFLLLSVHSGAFPDAFIEGRGLTPFKVASEYIISLILAAAIIYLRKKSEYFEKPVLNLLIWSMITTIASEMAFTLYKDVYGFFNLLGHYFKIVSFYLIYAALIKTNLKKPYESLVHEIDERKQTQEALAQATQEWQDTFDATNDALWTLDQDQRVLRSNKAAERLFHRPCGEMIGKHCWEIVHSTVQPIPECPILRVRKNLHRETMELQVGEGWFAVTVDPILDAAGQYSGAVHIVSDITERKKAEEKILKLNRVYSVISQINQAIVRAREKDKILSEACRIAVEYGKFRMAWIGMIDEETHLVKPVAYSGAEDGYLSKIKGISVDDVPEGCGQTGTAIREGRYYVCDDIEKDPRMGPWREEALKRGYRSSMALPIRHFNKVIGAFSLYASIPDFFDLVEIHLLYEVTNDISFAIEAIETAKKKMEAEEELKKHREHLEEMVKERTTELEKKIAEIERLNRLFVGRELRMKELKERIGELEKGNE